MLARGRKEAILQSWTVQASQSLIFLHYPTQWKHIKAQETYKAYIGSVAEEEMGESPPAGRPSTSDLEQPSMRWVGRPSTQSIKVKGVLQHANGGCKEKKNRKPARGEGVYEKEGFPCPRKEKIKLARPSTNFQKDNLYPKLGRLNSRPPRSFLVHEK